jgi:hypothetical protein
MFSPLAFRRPLLGGGMLKLLPALGGGGILNELVARFVGGAILKDE